MKKPNLILLVLSLTVLFIVSCSDSTSPDKEGRIEGRVVDAVGNPIADARIMLSYNLKDRSGRPSTPISFQLAEPSDVKVWITRHNKTDPLFILLDEHQTSGIHSISWDFKDINGITISCNFYDAHLKINSETTTTKFLVNRQFTGIGNDEINNYEANAITDENGLYSIDLKGLPFTYSDNAIEVFNADGEVIGLQKVSRVIDISLLHEDHSNTLLESVYIEKDQITTISDIVLD